MIVSLVLATALLLVLLVSLERSDTSLRLPVKALASAGFISVSLAAGALDSGYGQWVLVGLCLAWVGDVLLALPGRGAFLGGLVAFLLGHVVYVAAFGVRGVAWATVVPAAMGVALIGILVWRWLRPHVDPRMVGPVVAYVWVISAMVAMAIGTREAPIVVGAILFFLSDLFVARQRFVAPGHVNRLVGLPLYYAGQILLALSTSV